LFRKCHEDCCETTVKLPAQRVVVEAPAPRVRVTEQTRVSRGIVAPVIGTVYMPVAFPIAGLGIGGVGQRDLDVAQEDHNPLRSLHAAELARLQHDRALAVAKADVDAAKRAYDRFAVPAGTSRDLSPDCEQRLKELS